MPIMPNLRSVIAQVHGKSRSIGSHRNFSTSSPHPPPEYTNEEGLVRWIISRSFGAVVGYFTASYYNGDMVARYEAWLIEDMREKHKRYGRVWSDIGES